ncbi:Rad4-domain-containing protein [Aspergillus steynii IBT 23096]|uniref:Rad4-domain-containing protein n=1 Tax=Aspergillus steynii IBT 23096 TaxID=1392250 RepID=A0A2I2G4W3_9EURO|nr:Rad4-domain-containing protein [Aspergillus steynii IBT 23096]PLB47914.1 Rad4-domain-containing protein [Aspergillus steynii IBT 23096]
MPPFVPRKRVSSEDPPSAKRQNATPNVEIGLLDDDSSDSSLSDAPSDTPKPPQPENDESEDESDDEEVDWEDAIDSNPTATPAALNTPAHFQDLELTLDKNDVHLPGIVEGNKGPSKIERQIRIQTHRLHVQFLLYHNALRNAWANDSDVHEILRRKLPPALHKEVKKWRVASGLELPEKPPEDKSKKKKKKGKQRQESERDWGEGSTRLEPGQPDMSRGDPVISLLKVLAAYWKKQFKITSPGLRKHGYQPMSHLQAQISSLQNDDHDAERHGERVQDVAEFRQAAEQMEGSRDLGAQLFTALLRALDIEARLVASLQPLGFGWTKSETYTSKPKAETAPTTETEETEAAAESESDSDLKPTPSRNSTNPKGYDQDLPFPIYWTEVASPVTHEIIAVDPLVLQNAVASSPELQAGFEPRGAKAEKAKQVICYVVAYSSDKTAKDVTTRYLRRRTWPGKTKGYRFPVEKIPIHGRKGKYYEYDWFRLTLRIYERAPNKRTAVDDIEDAKDLAPNQPEKKPAKEGDTLQSLRASTEFVLERFLRREEALKPGAQRVRTFTTGRGAKAKEEDVYRRKDVVKCLSAESWHKEGRQVKKGEIPLKRVPIRAVTLLRKREVDELERETGEKPKQGLYAKYQTEYIIPPPIRDGVIPKNDYGNIDCFVPSMVPRGAAHIPWPGTVRLCKKLGIDYAEAVTGFEFGSKMAVPVIEGVVVAVENEDLLKDAWRADAAEKREKERRKAEARILQTWRKFLFGLRIAERVREEYGQSSREYEKDDYNPFTRRQAERPPPSPTRDFDTHPQEEADDDPADRGGGFLLPGEDDGDDGGLIVEKHHEHPKSNPPVDEPDPVPGDMDVDEDDDNEGGFERVEIPDSDTSSVEELSPPPQSPSDDNLDSDPEVQFTGSRTRRAQKQAPEPPSTRRRTRNMTRR